MLETKLQKLNAAAIAAVLAVSTVGCENLPGSDEAQGATIGGLGGAAAGAIIGGEDHRLAGALIGAALGAGGGYVIGANADRISGKDRSAAERAARTAQTRPATAQEAVNAATADLNNDGFVTMDEVVAMDNAGLSNDQMLEKLRATGQVFELTAEQRSYLQTHGVSEAVIREMPELNRDVRDRLLTRESGVVGRPATGTGGSTIDDDNW